MEPWAVAATVVAIVLVVSFLLLSALGMFRGRSYEYLLLNIAPGTSEEALLEHLRSNLQSKLKDRGYLFGKTKALFACTEQLSDDEWENCQKYGGRGLVLVYKKSNKAVQCSHEFTNAIRDCTHIQTSVKKKDYHDANRKVFHRVQLSGPWAEIIVILDQLPDSDNAFNRQDPSQMSFNVHDETTRTPLIGKSNRSDKRATRQEKALPVDVVPQVARPHCESNKRESLDVEEELYRYAMKHHRGEMEQILHPKPLVSEFRSGALILVGQACLISKAAEDMAVFCQKLTVGLSKVAFKLPDDINAQAFKSEAESQIAAPNKTLLLTGSDSNTLILYGPKDKLRVVKEGLKSLENRLRSPTTIIQVKPKGGSVTSQYTAERHEVTPSFPQAVAPRNMVPSSSPNGPNMGPKQHPVFTKVEVSSVPMGHGYQGRSNGVETSHGVLPQPMEKAKPYKLTVSVNKGDLRNQTTNVIVNPANSKLQHRGGAAKAIAESAGPRLISESQGYIRKYGELKTGQVMHTSAGSLSPRIQHVIHAVGPSASSYPVETDLVEKMVETFFNCLKYANDRLHAKSMSIPAISSGIYGVPKELVARAAHTAVKRFEKGGTGGAMTLEQVNFVNIDDESTNAFRDVFEGPGARRMSVGDGLVMVGSPENGKSRSKSADHPKRNRVLKQEVPSATVDPYGAANGVSNGVTTATVANGDESDDCVICMETMTDPKTLPCGHKFCSECIEDSFAKCQPKCPSCGRLFGVMRGNQPPGKMHCHTIAKSLAGYEKYKTILVEYDIPNGIQNDTHPNPGVQYFGTNRTGYLPDSKEGREVCDLLQKAFDAGLIFTVGRSTTTNQDNRVIWNDIHHKTSEVGPYGYPDPSYLSRVKEELKAKGITSETDDGKHNKQTAI